MPRVVGRHLIESIRWRDQAHAVLTEGWAHVTDGDSGIQILRVTEGEAIPEPTEGPTITPIQPARAPAEATVTSTPTATLFATPVDTGHTDGRVWLPLVVQG